MRKKIFFSILALMFAGGCAFSQPSYDFPPPTPIPAPTVAVWTPPAPITDAHGCSAQDWDNAYSYRADAKDAANNERSAAESELRDRHEHLKKLEALDDRKDLDAKVERHFLEAGDDNASAAEYRSFAKFNRENAARELGDISQRCRDWLEKDGK